MERSLSDWYSLQLGNPQSFWQASVGAQQGHPDPQTEAVPLPLEPVIDFDALRKGFEQNKSLGLDDLSAPASASQLRLRQGPQIVPYSSGSDPQSVAPSSAASLPIPSQHAADHKLEVAATVRSSSGSFSTSQKKLLQGRESQRRFREKAKVG